MKATNLTKSEKKVIWKTKDKDLNLKDENEVDNVYLQNIYKKVMEREFESQQIINQARINLDMSIYLNSEIKEEAERRGIKLEPFYRNAEMIKYFHGREELENSPTFFPDKK